MLQQFWMWVSVIFVWLLATVTIILILEQVGAL